ncbi:MAG: divalent-cation tolerance protein CutA [Candidatus Thiodiazotropha sp. (ex Monitilora ramsayi)]|nr:divalent-cation tolerance protein CutA [Candidatus Thiodiazotropha sp. (ex Monitilora ramsayi)]
MPTTHLLILSTAPDPETAEQLANALIEQRLAACVNLLPQITSLYEWKGKLQKSGEVLMMIKSTKQNYSALEAVLRAKHPYELPEILAVPVEQGLQGYLDWVERCTNTKIT